MDGGEARYHQLRFVSLMKSSAAKASESLRRPLQEIKSHPLEGVPSAVSLLGVTETWNILAPTNGTHLYPQPLATSEISGSVNTLLLLKGPLAEGRSALATSSNCLPFGRKGDDGTGSRKHQGIWTVSYHIYHSLLTPLQLQAHCSYLAASSVGSKQMTSPWSYRDEIQ
jgi:hypothetical protein